MAWSGFGAILGLAGSVCVLLSAPGRGSLFGASEFGLEICGPVRFETGSGDGQGLVLGDWDKSGDWGGTQNFLTGWIKTRYGARIHNTLHPRVRARTGK